MVTEMISMKLEDSFLKAIDSVVKKEGYQSRTEFIRTALREKIDQERYKEIYKRLGKLRGKAKTKTTDEDLHRIREEALKSLAKKKGWNLD